MAHRAVDLLLETAFPTRCVSCHVAGAWWCGDCQHAVEPFRWNVKQEKLASAKKGEASALSGSVADGLDGLIATGFYHDPRLRAVIHALKFNGATCVLPEIRAYLKQWATERLEPWPWAGATGLAIQPLITSVRRDRSRGFDQARLLAGLVHETIVPWATSVDLLQRKGAHTPQSSLDPGPLRQANVLGSYDAIGPVAPTILLVDDVVTTGATMREAARTLKATGAERVFGFAIAVGK